MSAIVIIPTYNESANIATLTQPIRLGRSLQSQEILKAGDVMAREGKTPLVFTLEEYAPELERNLRGLGVAFSRVDSFRAFSSRVSWVRMARKGTTVSHLLQALDAHNLDAIKPIILVYALDSPEP